MLPSYSMNCFQSVDRSSNIAVSKPSWVVAMLMEWAVSMNRFPKLLRWLVALGPRMPITRLVFAAGLLTDRMSGLFFAFSCLNL